MKFCKLITEVDLELLEELVDNGYPVDRIEENGQVYYKTPAMLCQNLKVNDEVRNYSNGLISMSIENVRKKKGLYRTGNLLIDMDSNIIQKGKEKIFIPTKVSSAAPNMQETKRILIIRYSFKVSSMSFFRLSSLGIIVKYKS